ncbi:hypothetical protein O7M46_10340, partial [Bisgaard Taxon 45]|nr:hypothetical protein [Bisgaard Taxon 45]
LEVKRCNADGSVGFPHVRVGHRQVLIIRVGRPQVAILGVFFFCSFPKVIFRIILIVGVFISISFADIIFTSSILFLCQQSQLTSA